MPQHRTTMSGLEFVSEVSDLAAGAGMLIFTLAPFALPVLALTALAAVALLVPAVVGVVLAGPFAAGVAVVAVARSRFTRCQACPSRQR